MNIETCAFVSMSSLIPPHWWDWAFYLISDSAPFSWGDNNRTMVAKHRFHDHCTNRFEDVVRDGDVSQAELDMFFVKLDKVPDNVYIDLEH